ncbi:MAG: quinol dehydrogenase ferredoxin subunit NapH [Burkholderiaceae bacterium]
MSAAPIVQRRVGVDALAAKGWWRGWRWLVLRRAVQLAVLALFLVGPWFGLWIVKGNLASSLTLGVLPLTDPYVLLQTLAAGNVPLRAAWIGAAIVLVFYVLVGGRSFCSWVCPMNPVTDTAAWLRRRLGLKGGAHVTRRTRYAWLAMTLIVAVASGSAAWELVSPVSLWQRGLIFGLGAGWAVALAIFLFDLFVMSRGWCGRLCPVGAFYSLPGRFSVLRVVAAGRERCNDCLDCFAVCPEPVVIRPALKALGGAGPVITSSNCTNCGRCIDICAVDVFGYGTRWHGNVPAPAPRAMAAAE